MSIITTAPTMSVHDIKVTPRRTDMGDIDALARDIAANGLRHPIGVTTTGLLAYGSRRLEAVKRLGWQQVPVVLVDLADPLASTPNHYRGFRVSELVGIARLIDEREQRISKLRNASHLPQVKVAWAGRTDLGVPGRSADKVAPMVGLSRTTYSRARFIQRTAESDLRFQRYVDRVDAGETTVTRAYDDVKEELDAMNPAVTNGNGRAAPRRERPPTGMQKRTGLKAQVRLERIAMSLEGYAEALPAMHTRGEDVNDVLERVAKAAGKVRRAANNLIEGGTT